MFLKVQCANRCNCKLGAEFKNEKVFETTNFDDQDSVNYFIANKIILQTNQTG